MDGSRACLYILNLPKGSRLTLDNRSIILERDDFVGVRDVPPTIGFHLLIARGAVMAREKSSSSMAATAAGFFVEGTPKESLIRRYDVTTEEISCQPVDDQTKSNLFANMDNLGFQRLLPYTKIITTQDVDSWREMTRFISSRLFAKRDIHFGEKLVPSTYDMSYDHDESINLSGDGRSISYPSIPVIDGVAPGRHLRHAGTKRYLETLSPAERTSLFMNHFPASHAMESILEKQYENVWEDLLGDIQLSFLLFLNLNCFLSFQHWKDLVALLCNVEKNCVHRHVELFNVFLNVLGRQILFVDADFFEDSDISGGNFLRPSLQNLDRSTSLVDDRKIIAGNRHFRSVISNRFPGLLDTTRKYNIETSKRQNDSEYVSSHHSSHFDTEDDDEHAAVIVPRDEILAFEVRAHSTGSDIRERSNEKLRGKYPFLFAAMAPNEDILMTCARALDTTSDVAVVREAAAYLMEVETRKDASMI